MKYENYKHTQSKTTVANITECFTLRVDLEPLYRAKIQFSLKQQTEPLLFLKIIIFTSTLCNVEI